VRGVDEYKRDIRTLCNAGQPFGLVGGQCWALKMTS
jgi:hypothetical protein